MNTIHTSLTIRAYEKKDCERVIEILAESFYNKFQKLTGLKKPELKGFLKDIGACDITEGCFVAQKNGKIAGVILLNWKERCGRFTKHFSFIELSKKYGLFNCLRYKTGSFLLKEKLGKDMCYVEHIAVAKKERGRGIGSALLAFGENFACQQLKKKKLSLNVAAGNNYAINIYLHLGFHALSYESSFLTRLFLNEKKWFYMEKEFGTPNTKRRPKQKYVMQELWILGFIGIIGFFKLPDILTVLNGGDWRQLLNLSWFLWFLCFLPEENKQ